jgi:HJR/Mrr/RecB family endonuclease
MKLLDEFRKINSPNTRKILGAIEKEYGGQVDLKMLFMVFSAGLMGNPRPTFKIEEKFLKIIGRYIQDQIDDVKKNRTVLAEQSTRIEKVRRYKSLRKLQEMDPKDFEYWTAGYFIDRGYKNVVIVPPGPDFGVDVSVTTPGRRRAIVQCKRYHAKHAVNRPTVQQTYGVMHAMMAHRCYVVTTSYFTRDAIDFVEVCGKRNPIFLIDGKELTRR